MLWTTIFDYWLLQIKILSYWIRFIDGWWHKSRMNMQPDHVSNKKMLKVRFLVFLSLNFYSPLLELSFVCMNVSLLWLWEISDKILTLHITSNWRVKKTLAVNQENLRKREENLWTLLVFLNCTYIFGARISKKCRARCRAITGWNKLSSFGFRWLSLRRQLTRCLTSLTVAYGIRP